MLEIVKILEGKPTEERRDTICSLLKERGYDYDVQIFKKHKKSNEFGENIIVDVGEGERTIIICSHYDVAEESWGANCNASSNAVMISLLEKLWEEGANNKLKFIFFDYGEKNLLGAKHFMETNTEEILAVFNLDMVGSGNIIAAWPFRASDFEASQEFASLFALEKTAQERNYVVERLPNLLKKSTDSYPFRVKGIEAFTITMFTQRDLEEAQAALPMWNPKLQLETLMKNSPIFAHYQSEMDSSRYLQEDTLSMVRDIIMDTIIELES
ncbi:M28 family metallopeptidase [Nanoarchaeota archaeon]